MGVEADIAALKEKHAALEAEIDREMARPMADSLKLTQLKREKLQLKDQIARLSEDQDVA